jgi:hypothetical protein
VRGLTVGDSGGATGDSSDISGTNIGTLTLSEITPQWNWPRVELNRGGNLAANIASVTVTQSTGGGINLDTIGGSLTDTGHNLDRQSDGRTVQYRIKLVFGQLHVWPTNLDRRGSAGIQVGCRQRTIQFGAATINNQNSSGTSAIAIDNTTATRVITIASAAVNNNSGCLRHGDCPLRQQRHDQYQWRRGYKYCCHWHSGVGGGQCQRHHRGQRYKLQPGAPSSAQPQRRHHYLRGTLTTPARASMWPTTPRHNHFQRRNQDRQHWNEPSGNIIPTRGRRSIFSNGGLALLRPVEPDSMRAVAAPSVSPRSK